MLQRLKGCWQSMVIFKDRKHAGKLLAEELLQLKPSLREPIVLGIPRGGVPIGFYLTSALNCPLDALVLRKLPLPQNDQMGFGAVTLDKRVILNEYLIRRSYVSKDDINLIVNEVYEEVLRRNRVYREDKPFPNLKDRSVIMTDDGLATGYTMLTAVKFVQEREAEQVIVAVPVAHFEAYDLVKRQVNRIICLYVSKGFHFAVASFYESFPDLKDSEVVQFLKKEQEILK
jgi:putative phosphoribosyl transferase